MSAPSSPTSVKIAQGLTEFPSELYAHAHSLETLDLSDNNLSMLPADFHRFVKLKRLFLTNNCFREIPAVLAQCHDLVMVSFKGNGLQQFGEGVLPDGLEWLILTDNQLSALPADMGRYRQLKKCALAGNQLQQLPASMQQCTELGLLRLSLNRFAAFPTWLFQLPKLAWLALGANPATPVAQACDVPQLALEDFSLHETLGVGASGVIYRATPKNAVVPAPHCAVKMFKGWLTSDGCPKDEMANALHAGSHPNLIPIYAQLHGGDLPGLAMALIPPSFVSLGRPPSFATITRDTYTDTKAERAGFTAQQVWLLACQVAAVVHHLHEQQLVHGDLYAHNMLINDDGQLYLGDFGAATSLWALPAAQQHAMKQQEIRAFGYWLDDMLRLCRTPAGSTLHQALTQLVAACWHSDVSARPDSGALITWLENSRQRNDVDN